jgi:hypothetical protein
MTVLDVSAQTYYDAADICAKASSGYFEAFKAGMQSFGDTTNMAGSVGEGKQWADSYDQQCKDIYSMSIDIVLAFDGYAQVLKQAGYNHALADHDPNSGTPAPEAPNTNPSFTLSPQELVSLLVPPSAGGDGRGLVDDGLELAAKVGIPIPDGDTKKLLRSANVWEMLANNDSVTAAPGELERAAALFEQVTSPDANFIDEDLRELKTAASDLAGAYGELAQACRDQKQAHDDLRADLEKLCDDLAKAIAVEVAVSLTLAVAASAVTFGVGAAAVAARTAVAVARIIDKFVDLIRIAVKAAKLRTVVTVQRATAKTKATIARIKDLTAKLAKTLKDQADVIKQFLENKEIVVCTQGALAGGLVDINNQLTAGGEPPDYVVNAVKNCIAGAGVGYAWDRLSPIKRTAAIGAIVSSAAALNQGGGE